MEGEDLIIDACAFFLPLPFFCGGLPGRKQGVFNEQGTRELWKRIPKLDNNQGIFFFNRDIEI